MKPYDITSFTNEFGQVIEPGQSCVAVAKGRSGSISTYKGRYLGVRTYTDWKGDTDRQVVVEVVDKEHGYLNPETGDLMDYYQCRDYEAAHPGVKCKHGSKPKPRITNLYLNLIYPSSFA